LVYWFGAVISDVAHLPNYIRAGSGLCTYTINSLLVSELDTSHCVLEDGVLFTAMSAIHATGMEELQAAGMW